MYCIWIFSNKLESSKHHFTIVSYEENEVLWIRTLTLKLNTSLSLEKGLQKCLEKLDQACISKDSLVMQPCCMLACFLAIVDDGEAVKTSLRRHRPETDERGGWRRFERRRRQEVQDVVGLDVETWSRRPAEPERTRSPGRIGGLQWQRRGNLNRVFLPPKLIDSFFFVD